MSDVYVLGSGPTVDHVKPSFFDGKRVISVNSAADRMGIHGTANVTVHTHYHAEGLRLARKYPGNVVWMPEGDAGHAGKPTERLPNTVYYPHHPTHYEFTPRVKGAGLIVGSTSTHGAMHLACRSGARNVILVGIDCGTLDGQANVSGYDSGDLIVNDTAMWLARWEEHLRIVKAWLVQRYDVSIHSLNPFLNMNLEGHLWKGSTA